MKRLLSSLTLAVLTTGGAAMLTLEAASASDFRGGGRGHVVHSRGHGFHGAGTGLAIALGATLLATALADVQAGHRADHSAGRLACDLSMDHYAWTRDNARRRFAQWRDEISPDNPARAQQMGQFRRAYARANACIAALGGVRQPPLG